MREFRLYLKPKLRRKILEPKSVFKGPRKEMMLPSGHVRCLF